MNTSDIVEIQQLMALYGHAFDSPDRSLLTLLFTDDAVFDVTQQAGGSPADGIDAIRAHLDRWQPFQPSTHNTTNIWVHEKDGETRVWSKWILYIPSDKSVRLGEYNDLVVRTPAGWRIKHRLVMQTVPKL
jgi:ketosteroid isomerase-like protein